MVELTRSETRYRLLNSLLRLLGIVKKDRPFSCLDNSVASQVVEIYFVDIFPNCSSVELIAILNWELFFQVSTINMQYSLHG